MKGNERNASALQKLNSSANKHLLILRFQIHFYDAGKENMKKHHNQQIGEIMKRNSREFAARENFHINDEGFHLLHEISYRTLRVVANYYFC